jgi:methylated-DNA-[protein]-cysteine S-methyltransferase
MPDPTEFFIDELATPLGQLQIISDSKGAIRLVGWHEGEERYHGTLRRWHGEIGLTKKKDAFGHTKAMRDYFAGDIHVLDKLPVASEGTDFQKKVWKTLRKIPAGETWSYGQMARHMGQASAMRAVGAANGRNPLPIVVPCHRVIGGDGSLTGFGGGLPTKQFLLALEQRIAGGDLFAVAG